MLLLYPTWEDKSNAHSAVILWSTRSASSPAITDSAALVSLSSFWRRRGTASPAGRKLQQLQETHYSLRLLMIIFAPILNKRGQTKMMRPIYLGTSQQILEPSFQVKKQKNNLRLTSIDKWNKNSHTPHLNLLLLLPLLPLLNRTIWWKTKKRKASQKKEERRPKAKRKMERRRKERLERLKNHRLFPPISVLLRIPRKKWKFV